jgi:predicted TIM-barrel fold metal-dependent hydrolase
MTAQTETPSDPVRRRRFLQIGTLGVAALAETAAGVSHPRVLAARTGSALEEPAPGAPTPAPALIDVNVSLSHWPFRRLPGDETAELVARLRSRGVIRAWAGSFDALLHRDVAGVNARLAQECRKCNDFLVPFGVVNPKLPDWEDDLRRCQQEHGMPGIRLHPNYHGYTLDDPVFATLLDRAADGKLIVQIALTMEDERTQHPLVQVPHVDARPLAAHAQRLPGLSLVLINAFRSLRAAALGPLASAGNVSFDIAMLENVGGVADLIHRIPASRVLFGSHAPFYYFESALFKIKESALDREPLEAITTGNAKRILS